MKKLHFFVSIFMLIFSLSATAQINQALTATASHSGGGATTFGPQNYNDGIITATPSAQPWGWVSSNGWIEYTWTSPVNFNAVAFYKADRPMTNCTFEYWDGTSYVSFLTYSGPAVYDSVDFPTISTTRLRFNTVSGSSNPNHREIRVWLNSFAPNDAAVAALDSPRVFCAGTENIVVTIANYGTTPIDSVDVDWEFNGVPQTGLRYIGLLDTIGGLNPSTAQVTLGTQNFPAGSSNLIKAWTSNPNGVADTSNTNDTLTTFVGPALQGNFTVNAALPSSTTNFTSMSAMATAFNNYGVCGPVTINVAPGVYNEELELGNINGTSSVNTITIDGGDSSTTHLLHDGVGNVATVTLDGTDWVTIKNMTIEATGTSGVAVLFVGGNDNCTISNNVLRVNTSSTSTLATNVTFSGSKTSPTTTVTSGYTNNTIANNRMRGGYYGVRMYGTTGVISCIGNSIVNNDMDSVYYYGAYVYYQDAAEVINNRIVMTNRGNINADGIYMYANNNGKINGNYVLADDYGVYWSNSNTLVRSLTRHNEMINNMVISNGDFATYFYSVDSVNFWFNSLQTFGASQPALYIAGSTAYPFTDWDLRNNIFSASGGAALDMATYTDTIFNKMDNNDYYTTGTTLIDINNTFYPSLAAYQVAQPLLNTSSLQGDPQFLSGTDLHVIGGFVNDSGDASVPVFVDIDGDVRPMAGAVSVDMGADEFDPPTCLPATNLMVYNPGLNGATLTWDATAVGASYQYVVVPAGSPLLSGTPVLTTLDSVRVTGLSASSAYDFYVRVACGRGDTSLWIGPASFNTANGIPFFQDFEAFAPGQFGNTFQEGWSQRPGTASFNRWESEDANNGNNENSAGTGPLWDHTNFGGPTNGMYMFMETSTSTTGDTVELYSPPIFIDSNLSVVEFGYWYFNHGSNIDKMEVLVDTNGVKNLLATYTGQQQLVQSDPWLFASHFLNGYNGKSVTLIFRGYGVPCCSGDIAVDDISLDPVLPLDAGVTDVISPSGSLCPGNVIPVIEVRNFGSAQLDSVKVYWDINGTLDSTTYVGTIAPGATTNVSLATINVMAGQLYNIQFYTGDVNGQTDQFAGNDSLTLTGLRTGIAGTVTVNPSLPASATNFISFSSLASTLNNNGVCGNAIVNVAPGVYTGAVQFDDIPGASATNTLTIDGGDSSTTFLVHNGSGNIATLTLNNTDWITVKNFTIEATGTSGVAVLFTGGNDNCTISNNVLRVNTSSTSTLATNVTFSGSTTSPTTTVGQPYTNNTIANNRMRGGYYGVRMYGTTSTIGCIGNTIVNNDMDSVYYYGAYVYYQDAAEVINNSIVMTNRGNINADGIYMYANNNGKINGNYVLADDYAVYWSNSNTLVRPLTSANEMINNMVISNGDFATYFYSVDSVNFWYNSLQTFGPSQPALYIAGSTAYPFTDWDLRNNILSATGGAALDMATYTDTIFNKMDNNVYYTTGTILIDINNTTYGNLPAYQTAQPLLNTASLEGDPQFLSATDLHIVGAFVNDSADASVPIFVDYDGDVRPATGSAGPDIGADEYDPPTCPPPFSLSAFNPTLDSITLAWASASTGVSYEVVVVASGAPQTSGTPFITTSDTVGIGSLTASTRYDYYVRVICGRGDTSQWIGPQGFGTANGIPYFQDFQTWTNPNFTGLINEEGWYTLGTPVPNWQVNGTTSSGATGPIGDHTIGAGGTFVYLETSGGTTGNTDTLWSAPIYFAPGQNAVTLEYWYHMHGAAMGSLEVYAVSQGVMTPLLSSFVGQQHAVQTDPWLSATANIGGFGGQSVQLMFVGIRGTSFTSDMAIDDIRLFIPAPTDGGVSDILGPNSGCGLGTDTVVVEITNFGTGSISNFPVQYTLNGGTPVIETYTGTIASGATATYAFTATVNLSTTGTYTIDARTNIAGDGDATNDADSAIVESIPLIGSPATTFYVEDFENGAGGWTTTGSLWARGVPSGTVISTAGSGNNAWVTNLSGIYPNSANDYLVSPCFDFTGAANPAIEFAIQWDTESGWDGGTLESSIDGGATWQVVGALGDTVNWYNGNANAIAGDAWVGSSAGWVVAAHDLFSLSGQSSVLLRFRFASDGSVNNFDGMGIDNIKIYNNINVGIEDQASNAATFALSPNPSNGLFNLQVNTQKSEQLQMVITDMNGKLVYQEQLNVNGGINKSMDLSQLPKGMYFLRLFNDDISEIEKIIIQ